MIAVTFALPSESSAFLRHLRQTVRGAAGPHTISGTFHGQAISVLHTGVGEKTTRARLTAFLQQAKPDRLISSGFAGALGARLRVGDVFLDEQYSEPALIRGSALPIARLTTVSEVIENSAARAQLALQTKADAVDMETACIAELCRAAQVPMMALRVISDSPAQPLPAPAQVLFDVDQQRTPALPLALHLLRHPQSLIDLLQFARRVARARVELSKELRLLLKRG